MSSLWQADRGDQGFAREDTAGATRRMKELTHTDCGGELSIVWVYKDDDGHACEVEFECLKCKESFSYTEGLE